MIRIHVILKLRQVESERRDIISHSGRVESNGRLQLKLNMARTKSRDKSNPNTWQTIILVIDSDNNAMLDCYRGERGG
jgi:hypothetical protein